MDDPTFFPNVIVGTLLCIGGLLVWRYRNPFFEYLVKMQGVAVGKRSSRLISKTSNGLWVGVAGVMAAVLGVAAVVGAIVRALAS